MKTHEHISAGLSSLATFESDIMSMGEVGDASTMAMVMHVGPDVYATNYEAACRHFSAALRQRPDALLLKVTRALPAFEWFGGEGEYTVHYLRFISAARKVREQHAEALKELAIALEVEGMKDPVTASRNATMTPTEAADFIWKHCDWLTESYCRKLPSQRLKNAEHRTPDGRLIYRASIVALVRELEEIQTDRERKDR